MAELRDAEQPELPYEDDTYVDSLDFLRCSHCNHLVGPDEPCDCLEDDCE